MSNQILSINFSTNWNNKLDSDIFTTIRGVNSYYSNNFYTGSIVQIKLKEVNKVKVKVMSKGIVKFGDIPKIAVMLDTGYSYEASLDLFSHFLSCTKEELKTKEVVFLTFNKF